MYHILIDLLAFVMIHDMFIKLFTANSVSTHVSFAKNDIIYKKKPI